MIYFLLCYLDKDPNTGAAPFKVQIHSSHIVRFVFLITETNMTIKHIQKSFQKRGGNCLTKITKHTSRGTVHSQRLA